MSGKRVVTLKERFVDGIVGIIDHFYLGFAICLFIDGLNRGIVSPIDIILNVLWLAFAIVIVGIWWRTQNLFF